MATNDGIFELLKKSAKDFMDDHCPRMAAALAYYTIFSLPPLLILILMLVGLIWDPQAIERALEGQFAQMVGPQAAEEIHTIIQNANRPGTGGPLATLLGIAALVFGATGAFIQLQAALNRAWEVEPDPEQGGLKNFLLKRLFSFGMILGIAFLLLVSLVLSAAISSVGQALAGILPGGLSDVALQALNLMISFAVIALLFAAIFKILPDATIAWRDVWVGAIVTALLFVAGKFAIGFYLGRSDPGQAFGAAGALAVLLLWIYYSGLILLFGAEFTQRWAESRGTGIEPEEGAVRVVEEKRHIRDARTEA
jgi:membrane protein